MTEVLGRLAAAGAPDDRFYGVTIGLVTNTKDPDGLGRVRVTMPWLGEGIESGWARVAAPMAGAGRGCYLPPEVDDEVLVAFEHGDPEFPYVLGGLWNGTDKPPAENSDGRNDVRVLRSRSGHVIRLVDTKDAELVEIVDGSGRNSIVISTKDDTVTITAGADVEITAAGTLRLHGRTVEITSDADLTVHGGGELAVESDAVLTVKGRLVQIN
ncbi:phage baseplate assembly protein V [Pseudonocardia sp.]|uniref:phage baseplate assembly protein V n=1 Tax=Pseudonocardia sp. TaxID=60912 RepID=UPI003D13587F